ncbi:hypothetical protein GCM10008983_09210 [Lentibacillus halophilus]|uniref:Capsule polysaccharide biosynthesis protein n=1 Tax=Lentibacillus halophilus TaxID=295065 RepID=A0ABN0Z5N3_9BACI
MPKSEFTIRKVCQHLWQLERDNDLINLDICGIKIWQLIRFQLFTKITEELQIYGQAHTQKNNFVDKLKYFPRMIFNSIFKNPMQGRYTRDYIIFDHPRKMKLNNYSFDIYTHYFIKTLEDEQYDVVEAPYLYKHLKNFSSKNRRYSDAIKLKVFLSKHISSLKISTREENRIKHLETIINKTFNTNLYLVNFIKSNAFFFKHQYHYYFNLLKKRRPSKIYILVSYGSVSLISAAKDLGIEVIEFQHGVITDYHFGYNFGDPTQFIEYFPDKILTFGDYWGHTKGFPEQTKIEVYGFPYLEQQLEMYKGTPKRNNQVLILSQGTIGKKLSVKAKEIAQEMPDYYFIYKLHPGEYDRWKSEYPDLVEASTFENLEVIDHNEKSLYSYFAESEFQIGVNSTAIFEGMTLGCKTILVNLQGIEYMDDLINENIVMLADNSSSCIKAIKDFKVEEFDKEYFFKSRKDMKQ